MGGYGSGRRYGSKRSTSDMWRLDVYCLYKQGMLAPGRVSSLSWSQNGQKQASINMWAEDGHIVLKYRSKERGGEWEDKQYPVFLDWTACHFGGKRPWFLCPCCGRRVAVLWGRAIYACRHCHNLAYECQREETHSRLLRRKQKIRDRLGWESDWGFKPKGMHQRTFDRLVDEFWKIEDAMCAAMVKRFGFGL